MNRKTGVAIVAALFSVFPMGIARSQWSSTGLGVVEYDTKQTLLLLAGVSASPGGAGLKPVLGVQGYYLKYDVGTTSTNVNVVKPYVGLHNGFTGGSVAGTVGYAFSDKTITTGTGGSATAADQGKGVVATGSWDYWGTGGPMGYQLLGSYNFGTESLWSRGRISTRFYQLNAVQRRIGAEVAYLHGKDYQIVQPGAVLEFHDGKGTIFGLGSGMKFFDRGGGSAVYFKGELIVPLFR